MAKSDNRFGRRGEGNQAEPTISFAPRGRDAEPRGPRLNVSRDDERTPRVRGARDAAPLHPDEERPIYLEKEERERSSKAWIGIVALAAVAGFGVYGWHLYTAPVTVEPMPVSSQTPADSVASASSDAPTTPPTSQ